ncbi:MAG: hypothetical protein ACQ9MH_19995 [Nitrospinales bacterium]
MRLISSSRASVRDGSPQGSRQQLHGNLQGLPTTPGIRKFYPPAISLNAASRLQRMALSAAA